MLKFISILIAITTSAYAGSPFIFKGSVAKNLAASGIEVSNSSTKQIIDLNVDPRLGAGVSAPIGSIGMGVGDVFVKVGPGNNQWVSTTFVSPLTTKGDIFTFSTSDARLPVGADGYFLKADSSETTGLKWEALPSSVQSINSQTGSSQTLTTGTSGTDFNIISASNTHTFNLPLASATTTGKLSSADWNVFNNKQPAGNYITDLTGDVIANGPGSVTATISNNSVTDAKFRQSAALSVVGNSTNSTANVADIVAASDHHVLRRSGTSLGFGLLVDSNIDTSAAIARSKLASGSPNHVLINDGSGVMSSEASLNETRGGTAQTSYTTGDILYSSATDTLSKLAIGTTGQVLTVSSGGIPSWQNATPTVFGSRTSPRQIVASAGITSGAGHMSTTAASQKIYVEGSGGAVNVTANPQIEAGTIDGQLMVICGRSQDNTVQLNHGNGLYLNGNIVLGENECITLSWDTSEWVELSRNN
jgi:hypothetical protein